MDKQCSHGVPWDAECKRCKLVSAREFVADMGPRVERAKERIKELERSILADEMESQRLSRSYLEGTGNG